MNVFPRKNNIVTKDLDPDILRFVAEKSPVAICICDENHLHAYHNDTFARLFGHRSDDIKGNTLESFFVNPDVYKEIDQVAQQENSWSGEVEMTDSSGKVIQIMMQVETLKDSKDNFIAFVGFFEDISEKVVVERELECQKEYLSTLRTISLGMFRRLDLSELLHAIILRISNLTQISNGFLYLYDREIGQLELKAASGSMTSHKGYTVLPGRGFAGTVFEKGDSIILDNYQQWDLKEKEPFSDHVFSIVGIPLLSGSRIEGVIGVCHYSEEQEIDPLVVSILEEFAAIVQIAIDNCLLFERQKEELEKRVSLEKERKEIEIRLHQSQRMESIGTLAGGIAHDFNNILSSIMGFTQIALAESQEGSLLKEDLTEIYTASIRARDLVQQILTFARQSDEKVNPIRVNLIVKEVLKFIRSSIPTTITIKQDIEAPDKVLANPTQIYQIFLNLFTNAAQAMQPEGGTLSVLLERETIPADKGALSAGKYLKATISDTGTGIAKEHLHLIFDPYFTTKEVGEGTGLGLATVHGAIKNMDGEILVQSEHGKGTTFTLYLPLIQNIEKSPERAVDNTVKVLGKKEHVLFVDDEPPITKVGKRMLEIQNFEVTALTDSQKALDLFCSDPGKFDAVVTDMTMPGLTGEKLTRELKKIRPDLPVILCTGHHQYSSSEEFLEKGVANICRKPISSQELGLAVRNAIDGIPPE